MGTTRTKADAKNELIALVRADNFLEPDLAERVIEALGRALIGRRGKTWLEIVVDSDEDRAELAAVSGEAATLPWAASLVLGMPLGDHAEIRIAKAA